MGLNPVLAMFIGIIVMMALIILNKLHPFPSLIISAILIAVLAMPFGPEGNQVGTLVDCVKTVTTGFGNTMASIGVVIGFGCIMGIFLEKSGAAKQMALTILKLIGVKNCDVVLGLTGFVVSIPVFCDSGFVILSSLAKEFSRLTKKSMVWLGGILGMGLYITHFMVPPTPGPLGVAGTFGADVGIFILLGIVLAIPMTIACCLYSCWLGNKLYQVPADDGENWIRPAKQIEYSEVSLKESKDLPSTFNSFLPLLAPILLILINNLAKALDPNFAGTSFGQVMGFLGTPIIAVGIGLLFGYMPANRAAKVNPIDALRSE